MKAFLGYHFQPALLRMGQVIPNPMATAAPSTGCTSSVILEFSVPSYRTAAAKQRNPTTRTTKKRKEGNRKIIVVNRQK